MEHPSKIELGDKFPVKTSLSADEKLVFAEAYRLLAIVILRFVGKMMRNARATEDITQQVFVALSRSILKGTRLFFEAGHNTFMVHHADHEMPVKLKTWLFRVAIRMVMKHWNSNNRFKDLLEVYQTPAPASDVSEMEANDDRKTLEVIMAKSLKADQRAILTIAAQQQHSFKEIGRMFGCKAGAARSRAWYARRKLERAIWKHDEKLAIRLGIPKTV